MLLIKVTCIIYIMTGNLQIRIYTVFVLLIYILLMFFQENGDFSIILLEKSLRVFLYYIM